MGALQDLSDMARDYGLGAKYFILVGGVLSALMLALFLWGRVAAPDAPPVEAAIVTPASGAPPSY